MRRRGVVLLVVAAACGGVSERDMTGAIAAALASKQAPAYIRDGAWAAVREIYGDRASEPLWVGPGKPRPEARALAQ